MNRKEKIGILGDGGWGTALALHLFSKGHRVMLWSAFPQYAALLAKKRENVKYLPGFQLPRSLMITSCLDEVIAMNKILILAIPTPYLRSVVEKIPGKTVHNKIIVNVSKGIENDTFMTPIQIVRSFIPKAALVALSGPSHAEEVARGVPTCVVVAAHKLANSALIQELCMSPLLRVYTSRDVIGLELGGALKNVIAIAAGMCDGLKFGANTKAALVTRGLHEIIRFGMRYGARQETFAGLAGIGDLITTCFSPFGRNRAVGEQLGKGRSIKTILSRMTMVAEGVKTAQSVHDLAARNGVEMPICEEVYKVIYHRKSPRNALRDLMMRAPKAEI